MSNAGRRGCGGGVGRPYAIPTCAGRTSRGPLLLSCSVHCHRPANPSLPPSLSLARTAHRGLVTPLLIRISLTTTSMPHKRANQTRGGWRGQGWQGWRGGRAGRQGRGGGRASTLALAVPRCRTACRARRARRGRDGMFTYTRQAGRTGRAGRPCLSK